jgi:hypothetical protein
MEGTTGGDSNLFCKELSHCDKVEIVFAPRDLSDVPSCCSLVALLLKLSRFELEF